MDVKTDNSLPQTWEPSTAAQSIHSVDNCIRHSNNREAFFINPEFTEKKLCRLQPFRCLDNIRQNLPQAQMSKTQLDRNQHRKFPKQERWASEARGQDNPGAALQVSRRHERLCSRAAAQVMPRKFIGRLSSCWSAGAAELIYIGPGFELIVRFQQPASSSPHEPVNANPCHVMGHNRSLTLVCIR